MEGEDTEIDPELEPSDEEELALRESQKKEENIILAQQSLFASCFFFLDREVSKCPLMFCIRSCGGTATWEGDTRHNTDVSDEAITHHVTDRGSQLRHVYLLREYIQPQWVFDSVNCRRALPFSGYRPGDRLPPHLSPFMLEREGDYVPPERLAIIQLEMDNEEVMEVGTDLPESAPNVSESGRAGGVKKRKSNRKKPLGVGRVIHGQVERENNTKNESLEEDKLREMLLTKKKRKLYDKLKGREKRRINSINKLRERRKQIERKRMLENNNSNNNTD